MKKLCLVFIFLILPSLFLYSLEDDNVLKPEHYYRIENKFKIVNDNIEYLKLQQIDCSEFIRKAQTAEMIYYDLRFTDKVRGLGVTRRFLISKLDELIYLTEQKIGYEKRIKLMSWVMVVIGSFIIIFFTGYSIYLYSGRK